MSHLDDEEVIGLSRALQKLPAMFRAAALAEFKKAFLEQDYAVFSEPEIIHYPGRQPQSLNKALLIIVECENFIFDLFFVPLKKFKYAPVVGRAYLSAPMSAHLIN